MMSQCLCNYSCRNFLCFQLYLFNLLLQTEKQNLNCTLHILAIIWTFFLIMEGCIQWRRVTNELKILTTDPDVQSYFDYERSGIYKKEVYIYGYLLPRTKPYNYGSFKVLITLPDQFPFKPPKLELLTYIYHPAIGNHNSRPTICRDCCPPKWIPTTSIGQWLEHYVNIIDRPDAPRDMYCVRNEEAQILYDQNRDEYGQKALAMVQKHSHPRPNRSMVSLKFASKQMICKQLNFQSAKINRLPLSNHLKKYLDLPPDEIQNAQKH